MVEKGRRDVVEWEGLLRSYERMRDENSLSHAFGMTAPLWREPQTVNKKLFSPRRGRIALSANERIAEFFDFAIQAKFAYVNKLQLPRGGSLLV